MSERIITALPVVLLVLLCFLLILAPLPFASVTIFWSTVLRAGAFVALAVALLVRTGPRAWRPLVLVALFGCGIAIFGLIQSVPLPAALTGSLSPSAAAHHAETRAMPGIETESMGTPLSLDPAASRSAALGWLAMMAAFVAGGVCGSDRQHRKVLALVVVGMGVVEVVFGAQRWLEGATTMWGIKIPGDPTRLRGTFVNADHLALYLEIGLALAFAWAFVAVRRARRQPSVERRVLEIALPIVCWLVLFVGLAFTGSRAGLVAATVAVVAQGVLTAASVKSWRFAPVGIAVGIVGVAAVAWIGLEQGFGRLLSTSVYEATWNARPAVYRASLELWQMFPVLGTGLGTFEVAFPLTQPLEAGDLVWSHAHNNWLEMLVTTGVVGFTLLLAGVVLLLRPLRQTLLASRSSTSRAAAIAALGAIASVALHEALDFGLVMPANAFTLAVVLGAALGGYRDYSAGIRAISPGTSGRRSAERSSSNDGSGSIGT